MRKSSWFLRFSRLPGFVFKTGAIGHSATSPVDCACLCRTVRHSTASLMVRRPRTWWSFTGFAWASSWTSQPWCVDMPRDSRRDRCANGWAQSIGRPKDRQHFRADSGRNGHVRPRAVTVERMDHVSISAATMTGRTVARGHARSGNSCHKCGHFRTWPPLTSRPQHPGCSNAAGVLDRDRESIAGDFVWVRSGPAGA